LLKNWNFQNLRWRTAAILKPVKWPYLSNRLTDFDEIWHGEADWLSTGYRPLKFRIFFKNQYGGGRNLENHKNRDIFSTVCPIFTKFGIIMQNGSLNRPDREKNLNFQNPRWRTAANLKKKPLNRHISATVGPILIKFSKETQICPLHESDR